jgi:hypothetical protein
MYLGRQLYHLSGEEAKRLPSATGIIGKKERNFRPAAVNKESDLRETT